MIKIFLILSLAFSFNSFASIENEVEAERFQRDGDVLTDTWSGLSWQDNKSVGKIKKDLNKSMEYCSDLTIGNNDHWRLPNKYELYEVAYPIEKDGLFNFVSPPDEDGDIYYRSSTYKRKSTWVCSSHTINMKTRKIISVFSCWNDIMFRCVSGEKLKSHKEIQSKIESSKNNLEYARYLKIAKSKNTILAYENLIKKYPKVLNIKEAKSRLRQLYIDKFNNENNIALQENNINTLNELIKNNPNASRFQLKDVKTNIFNLIQKENNISGYEWFVENYPKTSQVGQAIRSIHKLAFDKAKDINTVSSYNTFIITYPTANEVKQATSLAYDLEVKKYTDLGMFGGFFEKEAKIEKNARKLLIKAKQIERRGQDYNRETRLGYIIIANRMYDLLQAKFDDADATLRHLESEEFKDFVGIFKSTMKKVNTRLEAINRNLGDIKEYSKEILSTAKSGFADGKADRDMASFKTEQHREWEKFMQFRDKGYN